MKVCDHWREPCGYCPTCQCVTGERFIEVPVVDPDGAFTHLRVPASSVPFTATCDDTIIPPIIVEPRERSLTDYLPLDESGDAAVLAQAKRDYEEHLAHQSKEKSESCLRFAEIRHQARQRLIEQGRLVERVIAAAERLKVKLAKLKTEADDGEVQP